MILHTPMCLFIIINDTEVVYELAQVRIHSGSCEVLPIDKTSHTFCTLQVFEGLAELIESEVAPAAPPQGGVDPPPAAAASPPRETFPGDQGALVWAQYMRFLRRIGDATGSRQVGARIQ